MNITAIITVWVFSGLLVFGGRFDPKPYISFIKQRDGLFLLAIAFEGLIILFWWVLLGPIGLGYAIGKYKKMNS